MNEQPLQTSASFKSVLMDDLGQLSDDEFWQLASAIAEDPPSPSAPLAEYLLCDFGQGRCILPLTALREILTETHPFTFLPDMPTWMSGLTAWHGEVLAVIDLGAYLLNSTAQPQNGCVVIIQSDDITLGLLVSQVRTTLTLQEEKMMPAVQNGVWYSPQRTAVVRCLYEDALVLHIPQLFSDVVQQINSGGLL